MYLGEEQGCWQAANIENSSTTGCSISWRDSKGETQGFQRISSGHSLVLICALASPVSLSLAERFQGGLSRYRRRKDCCQGCYCCRRRRCCRGGRWCRRRHPVVPVLVLTVGKLMRSRSAKQVLAWIGWMPGPRLRGVEVALENLVIFGQSPSRVMKRRYQRGEVFASDT